MSQIVQVAHTLSIPQDGKFRDATMIISQQEINQGLSKRSSIRNSIQ